MEVKLTRISPFHCSKFPVGCLGSIFFVRDFLIPKVLEAHGGARLQGAFILDTIMNFNDTQFSQTLSPEWQAALPDFWNDIQVTSLECGVV